MTHIGFLEETVMNGKTGGRRRLKRAGALAVVAAAALLAAGCSGNSSSTSVSASALAKEVAFAQCMRSNGVTNFPDPNSSGGFTLTVGGQGLTINTTAAQSAYADCHHLLPSGGPSLAAIEAEIQKANSAIQKANVSLLPFIQCMHTHGEPNFPEPPETLKESGINIRSPQFLAAAKACKLLLPKGSSAP
jgi:hypothetical protein